MFMMLTPKKVNQKKPVKKACQKAVDTAIFWYNFYLVYRPTAGLFNSRWIFLEEFDRAT